MVPTSDVCMGSLCTLRHMPGPAWSLDAGELPAVAWKISTIGAMPLLMGKTFGVDRSQEARTGGINLVPAHRCHL